mmetsp:Transcript_26742/g.39604  ORF Transcript_26742/g.39604 Transcript_26742/m.39604 type:complete len:125 (+) Transcript_26742:164-538(+)
MHQDNVTVICEQVVKFKILEIIQILPRGNISAPYAIIIQTARARRLLRGANKKSGTHFKGVYTLTQHRIPMEDWCNDTLHILLGYSEGTLASYLIHVAKKAKSVDEISNVLSGIIISWLLPPKN